MLYDPITIAAICYGAVLLTGIIAGARGRIVVFIDLRDLLTTFAIIASTAIVALVIYSDDRLTTQVRTWGPAAIASVAIGAVGWRARKVNRSLASTALSVATKVPFAFGVPLLALQFIAPTGDTSKQRTSRRATALLLLMIIAPVLLLLVRDRKGVERYLGVG